jgi:predicted O-linked N-acetylglucosamine transferase (SPINDLY family)
MLTIDDDPARQLHFARTLIAKVAVPKRPAFHSGAGSAGRIRIGYFSSDFHDHATLYLMIGLLEHHDKSRFEIHAFSHGPNKPCEMRERLIDAVDAFHDIDKLSNADAAALARSLRIDIAIDLKGHTDGARTGIFAYGAAPKQVNFLGYPGTMGADFIDHIVADRIVIPEDGQHHFAEQVAYLPNSYQPTDSYRVIADRRFTRAQLGLPDEGFVFCCFNNNYKITPAEFDIWMRLLGGVEGSTLWLLEDNRWASANLRREARARGVDPARLVFAPRMIQSEHLARQACADLFLDTFTVNAHTTASDALWAGLPVVTKLGRSFVARVAGSLLHALDLAELVTQREEDYERLALALATDPARLAAIRARLAANRLSAPLFDTARYTRDIEALYERIHAGTV